jgi:hypothetical protein
MKDMREIFLAEMAAYFSLIVVTIDAKQARFAKYIKNFQKNSFVF